MVSSVALDLHSVWFYIKIISIIYIYLNFKMHFETKSLKKHKPKKKKKKKINK